MHRKGVLGALSCVLEYEIPDYYWQDIPVAEVILHPDYRRIPPGLALNDVMLLKLSRPAQFNDFVAPVCLPSPNLAEYGEPGAPVFGNNNLTVVGWGMTGRVSLSQHSPHHRLVNHVN